MFHATIKQIVGILALAFVSTAATQAQEAANLPYEEVVALSKSKGGVYVAIPNNNLSKEEKLAIKSQGGWIVGRYADGTAIVSFPSSSTQALKNILGGKAALPPAALKISQDLPVSGNIGVAVTFFTKMDEADFALLRNDFGITANEASFDKGGVLIGEMDACLLEALAGLPEVASISPLTEEPEPLGDNVNAFLGANLLNNPTLDNLTGQGVVTGVGDGGELGSHIDFNGRVVNKASGTYSSYGDHGDKMAGIIAGGGNLNEKYAGLAPEATILTQKTYRVFYYAPDYYANNNMRITNNSYGSSFTCDNAGNYEYYSGFMDEQMDIYPDLLHVVAAGNSGANSCPNYPTGYNTVLKTYASAKNVLTIGGVLANGQLHASSSKGPVKDGRIKPEIVSLAGSITSTGRNYNYGGIGATSAATATATGTATLLYEQYKNHNGGENPQGALIKAIMCNSADDGGNPGPDFAYGFGILNARRAAADIKEGNFFLGETTTEGDVQSFTIDAEPGQSELKIMLHWSDKKQPVNGVPALINDLDLVVVAPDGTEYRPWVLDITPANVTNPATRGEDHINNIEQVTIPTPQAGQYTVRVSTYNLDSPSQRFVIAHTSLREELTLTHPYVGQSVLPGETILVSWDAEMPAATGYTLEYSTDNGTSWSPISSSITASTRSYSWAVPSGIQSEAVKVRVTAQGAVQSHDSDAFYVLKTPANFTAAGVCGSYAQLTWDAVTDATSYEIYQLGTAKMELIAETTDTDYLTAEGLRVGEEHWFAVRAKFANGGVSRRTVAQSMTVSGSYPCPWMNDVEITGLDAGPQKGRELTSLSLPSNAPFTITLQNAGNNTVADIPLSITLNGTLYEEVVSQTLAPSETFVYTTSNAFDLSSAGTYNINVTVNLPGDNYNTFDTQVSTPEQLSNGLMPIPNYLSIEGAAGNATVNEMGVASLSYLDFNTNGTGVFTLAESSTTEKGKTLLMDNAAVSDISDMVFTRNLKNHGFPSIFIRTAFRVTSPTAVLPSARLEIRGTDTDVWLVVANLDATEWAVSPNINLSDILRNAGQDFDTSTQIRFILEGQGGLEVDEFSLMDPANLLPVEMVYFKATRNEENVLLEWKTATEENNDFFEVQVAEGSEALQKGEFRLLDQIKGNGTTTQEQRYFYNDVEMFKSGVRYYRLRQVDFDGQYSYSDIIPVFFEENAVEGQATVFPNPALAGETPNFHFELKQDNEVSLIVSDATGKVLVRIEEQFSAGHVTIPVKMEQKMAPGTYFVSAKVGGEQSVSAMLRIND